MKYRQKVLTALKLVLGKRKLLNLQDILNSLEIRKTYHCDDVILTHQSIAQGDLGDTFHDVLYDLGFEEDNPPTEAELNMVIRAWNKAVKSTKVISMNMDEALKYFWNHGSKSVDHLNDREVEEAHMNNPIIIVEGVKHIPKIFDGNHRILARKKQKRKDILVFWIKLPTFSWPR